MKGVLFVTNGHGETAIAERIACDVRELEPEVPLDHLALVGNQTGGVLREVGPRRAMPSGGLIAMGNARNLVRDLRAGLLGLTLAQAKYLLAARRRYVAVVAVGDVYALAMAFLARRPTVFVGTAKSVEVAPYGRFEERLLARAAACYVRDDATAKRLRSHGLRAEAANAIVDLFPVSEDEEPAARAIAGFAPALALFPGSRESAYEDAAFLLDVTREFAGRRSTVGAVLSIAKGLDGARFAEQARRAGWEVVATNDVLMPFELRCGGRTIVRGWRGALGPILARVTLVLGQAGTANEAAAAAGVPVVAFERDRDRKDRWYRERQRGLLGDALAVVPAEVQLAVTEVGAILDDSERRDRMGAIGRARMGPPGGARRIAERIAALVAA
jgi:uncharacterized protein (TIGR03492 family)